MDHEQRVLNLARYQIIETQRLLLRPVTLTDVVDMYDYASDEETTRFVFPIHQTLDETEVSIANYFMASPLGKWAIEEKKSKKMIGTIDLRIEEARLNGEIGYTLNRRFWGLGYTTEAAKILLTLGFEELELIHIYAEHDERNVASGRVMEKIGMIKEGLIPNYHIHKDEMVHMVLYGITKEMYKRS